MAESPPDEPVVRLLAPGEAQGPVLRLDEPLSFWGGVDPESGTIVDRRHPQRHARVTGRILVMPAARGSSSASSVLAECIRRGTAPAAILLGEPDPILAVGALVAAELYGRHLPVGVVGARALRGLRDGNFLGVRADGRLLFQSGETPG